MVCMIVVLKCRYFIVSFCKNEVDLKYIMKYIRGLKATPYAKNGVILHLTRKQIDIYYVLYFNILYIKRT